MQVVSRRLQGNKRTILQRSIPVLLLGASPDVYGSKLRMIQGSGHVTIVSVSVSMQPIQDVQHLRAAILEAYCHRHKYDCVFGHVHMGPSDCGNRLEYLFRELGNAQSEWVAWIDADILLAHSAPSLNELFNQIDYDAVFLTAPEEQKPLSPRNYSRSEHISTSFVLMRRHAGWIGEFLRVPLNQTTKRQPARKACRDFGMFSRFLETYFENYSKRILLVERRSVIQDLQSFSHKQLLIGSASFLGVQFIEDKEDTMVPSFCRCTHKRFPSKVKCNEQHNSIDVNSGVQLKSLAHFLLLCQCICCSPICRTDNPSYVSSGEPAQRILARTDWKYVLDSHVECIGDPNFRLCRPTRSFVRALEEALPSAYDILELIDFLFDWPRAWSSIPLILSPSLPWTQGYCDMVWSNTSWNVHESKYVQTPALNRFLPRMTFEEMQLHEPKRASALYRWLTTLGEAPGDSRLEHFVHAVLAEMSANASLQSRAFRQLLDYLHGEVVRHALGSACRTHPKLQKNLNRRDSVGRTALHIAASRGMTTVAQALVLAKPAPSRSAYVDISDHQGYTAGKLASIGEFKDTADMILEFTNVSEDVSFRSNEAAYAHNANCSSMADAGTETDTCRQSMSTDVAISRSTGGWNMAEIDSLLWLRPKDDVDQLCSVDVLNHSEFDYGTFWRHYVLAGRPLLVKGGANMMSATAMFYTREGLISIAGNMTINVYQVPYGYDQSKPRTMTLHEYVDFLDSRARPSEQLHYLFRHVQKAPSVHEKFSFAHSLPDIMVDANLSWGKTQFYLGGALMGSPIHFHTGATNSLLYGKKLWFLRPPSQLEWSNEIIYHRLVRTNGDPTAKRCMQESGDLLWVPQDWPHGAICLTQCIGVAHELE